MSLAASSLSGCESGKKREKGKRTLNWGQEGGRRRRERDRLEKKSKREGCREEEGCRDRDGMVAGTRVRRKGAGGGMAQEPRTWKKGSEAGKVVMTEGCGGDGVRIAKDNPGTQR